MISLIGKSCKYKIISIHCHKIYIHKSFWSYYEFETIPTNNNRKQEFRENDEKFVKLNEILIFKRHFLYEIKMTGRLVTILTTIFLMGIAKKTVIIFEF